MCLYLLFVRRISHPRLWPIAHGICILLSLSAFSDDLRPARVQYRCAVLLLQILTLSLFTFSCGLIFERLLIVHTRCMVLAIYPSTMADCLSGYTFEHTVWYYISVLPFAMVRPPPFSYLIVHVYGTTDLRIHFKRGCK